MGIDFCPQGPCGHAAGRRVFDGDASFQQGSDAEAEEGRAAGLIPGHGVLKGVVVGCRVPVLEDLRDPGEAQTAATLSMSFGGFTCSESLEVSCTLGPDEGLGAPEAGPEQVSSIDVGSWALQQGVLTATAAAPAPAPALAPAAAGEEGNQPPAPLAKVNSKPERGFALGTGPIVRDSVISVPGRGETDYEGVRALQQEGRTQQQQQQQEQARHHQQRQPQQEGVKQMLAAHCPILLMSMEQEAAAQVGVEVPVDPTPASDLAFWTVVAPAALGAAPAAAAATTANMYVEAGAEPAAAGGLASWGNSNGTGGVLQVRLTATAGAGLVCSGRTAEAAAISEALDVVAPVESGCLQPGVRWPGSLQHNQLEAAAGAAEGAGGTGGTRGTQAAGQAGAAGAAEGTGAAGGARADKVSEEGGGVQAEGKLQAGPLNAWVLPGSTAAGTGAAEAAGRDCGLDGGDLAVIGPFLSDMTDQGTADPTKGGAAANPGTPACVSHSFDAAPAFATSARIGCGPAPAAAAGDASTVTAAASGNKSTRKSLSHIKAAGGENRLPWLTFAATAVEAAAELPREPLVAAAAVISEAAPRVAEELEAHGYQQQQLLGAGSLYTAPQSPATRPAVPPSGRFTITRAQIHQHCPPRVISKKFGHIFLPEALKHNCFASAGSGSMLALIISVPQGAASLAAVAVADCKRARGTATSMQQAAEAAAAEVVQASTAAEAEAAAGGGRGGRQPEGSLAVNAQQIEQQVEVVMSTIHIQPCCKLTDRSNGSWWVVSNLKGCMAPFLGWHLVHVWQVWTLSWL